ncbi:DapH/DapD/GlmU-related protein [uncultured Bacteroides sp.]|uniref:DapH/DapD/GlmU-related protein n=1 Tax=uncultured Bacteroides sp. TaxID=162156 RepID=UPI00259465EE|nr:DapH/DapD/GlmU-related protein [uncultured Bacteroides sp.]
MRRLQLKNDGQKDAYTSPWSKKEAILIRVWEITWTLLVRWLPKVCYKWHIFLLRLFGSRISGNPFIAPTARIYAPWLLEIGHKSCLATRTEVYNLGPIKIGERVTVAQYAYLCNGTHDLNDRKLPLMIGYMQIDDDVFIGAKSIILPGLHLKARSIIGAGAVLTKDTEADGVYVGNPAIFIKKRKLNTVL